MEKQTFSEKKACFSASEQKIIQILLYFVITLPYNKKWNTLLLCPPGGHPIKWEEIIMANEKILVVDDDTNICELLRLYLTKEGYQVTVANDGEEGLEKFNQVKPDMVLLDVMMPKMDGLEVCRRIRKAGNTPVMMLTAKGETFDKVLGLELGADDYMVKPFAVEELLARIRCLMRRPGKWDDSSILKLGDISFDPESNRLFKEKKECTLSKREGALLEVFLRNPGQTLTRTLLLNRVWGMDSDVEEGNLDNYIHFLRRRLKSVDSSLVLKTVRGVGYQLEVLLYP